MSKPGPKEEHHRIYTLKLVCGQNRGIPGYLLGDQLERKEVTLSEDSP